MVSFAEPTTPLVPSTSGSGSTMVEDDNEEIERLLRTAGIDSAPMDPSSMDALRELVRQRKQEKQQQKQKQQQITFYDSDNDNDNDNKEKEKEKEDEEDSKKPAASVTKTTATATVAGTDPAAGTAEEEQHHHVSFNVASTGSSSSKNDEESSTTATTSFTFTPSVGRKFPPFASLPSSSTTFTSSPRPSSPFSTKMTTSKIVSKAFDIKAPSAVDRSIMDQLEFQTSILVDMQQRLEELYQKVQTLEQNQQQQQQQQQNINTATPTPTPTRSYTFSTTTRYYQNDNNQPNHGAAPATQTQTQTHQQQNYGPNQDAADFNNNINIRGGIMYNADAPRNININLNQQQQPQQQQPPQDNAQSWWMSILYFPYQFALQSYDIGRLYWKMSTDHVRPLDGGLLFKLIFVVLVLSARLGKMTNTKGSSAGSSIYNDTLNLRMYISVVVMILGFLYHTKYLQFTYQFVWEDNIPWRIYKGEDTMETILNGNNNNNNNNNRAVPPRLRRRQQQQQQQQQNNDQRPPNNNNDNNNQQPQNQDRGGIGPYDFDNEDDDDDDNNNNNNNNNGILAGWRNTILGGGIQPVGQEQHPIVAGIQDAIYLFASFFFSIFPMWRPEQPPQPVVRQNQNNNNNNNNNNGVVAGNDNDDHGDNNNNNNFGRLPEIRPPRDAMEAASDDEDDD